jgi:Kef-type K+ transport system membrane component KefB
MEFLLELLVLLLFAKVFGELLHRHGFSALIAEVLVGIALGPALLEWFKPDEYIWAVAMLGLVVLMLVTGMNSRFDLFMKVKFKALAIALCGMTVSFALGFTVPYVWGYPLIACLFVAAALSNTATEVVARVAERSRFSQLLVSAALIDDILAVYILGILSAAAIREILDLSVFFWATLGVIVFFFLVGYLSHKLMVERDIMRKLWRFERRGVPLTFALSLALALAVIAQRVGLHAIIGAYMAGLFIGRLRERPDALLLSRIRLNAMLEDVTTSLQSILTPMFFVYVGLTFAPQWGEIKFVMLLVLLIAAFAGKIIGCGLGAAAVGYKRKDSLAIGTAMCSRGSLEVAVLLFGLEAGVVPPDLFSMMVMVTLSTTLLTPLFFRRA